MVLTKEQLSELICKHSERENGLQDLLEIMLESMMVSERREYLRENSASGNKCNGFRPGHSYGHGRTLTFRIPRDRYGNSHLRILAILRHQEDECDRLAGTLYTKDLTQEQVGEVFQDIWRALQQGEHFANAGLPSRRCLAMAHALSGGLLPDRLHRLRTHEDPPQAERRNRSFLCSARRA